MKLVKLIETGSRMAVPESVGRASGESLLNGYRVSVLEDEKVLEISGTTT